MTPDTPGDLIREVRVPQLGEGLQEVRVLAFHKWPGELVRADEKLFEMETDKAVVEVESRYEGTLQEWLVQQGEVVPIGACIARLVTQSERTGDGAAGPPADALASSSPETPPSGRPAVPPRVRAYCRALGLPEAEWQAIPTAGPKLTVEDVARYAAHKQGAADIPPPGFTDRPLTAPQRVACSRLEQSLTRVVPGTIMRPIEWGRTQRMVQSLRRQGVGGQVSEFQVFAYAVAQAAQDHPKFRSSLVGKETLREWAHVHLGIAVPRPDDELTTAVVPDADACDLTAFLRTLFSRLRRARKGEDQADSRTNVLLSYMGGYEVWNAVPVLVAPAAAVLFVGAPFDRAGELTANLSLTFDHRWINGVGAAKFLQSIDRELTQLIEVYGS